MRLFGRKLFSHRTEKFQKRRNCFSDFFHLRLAIIYNYKRKLRFRNILHFGPKLVGNAKKSAFKKLMVKNGEFSPYQSPLLPFSVISTSTPLPHMIICKSSFTFSNPVFDFLGYHLERSNTAL